MAGAIGLVHAAEIWPSSPEARRRAWVDALFVASLSRSGLFEIATVADDPGKKEEQSDVPPEFDMVALHLHGQMATTLSNVIDDAVRLTGASRLVLFGDALVEAAEATRLAGQGHIVCRGLPSPIWASGFRRMLDRQMESGQKTIFEPVLSDWASLPGGSFPDPVSPRTLLVRTALGTRAREIGCGVTAFEGPRRIRQFDALAREVRSMLGNGFDHVEIVDADPIDDVDDQGGGLLALLESVGAVPSWTVSVAAVPQGDLETWRRLHSAGLVAVKGCLPSASQSLCENLHSSVDPVMLGQAFDAAHAAGVRTELALHIGGPGETVEDRKHTAAWLAGHAKAIDSATLLTYSPAPGSEMMVYPERHGIWWPPGCSRREWADRAGNNQVSRSKHLWEMVEVARGLGIEVLAPGMTAVREVRRHRTRILQRYEIAGVDAADEPQLPPAGSEVSGEARPAVLEAGSNEAKELRLSGPRMVEIELSAACNLRCIGCWCHSGLLSSDRHHELQTAQPLATSRIRELLDEMAALGVEEIQFSGSGEPLVNPDAVDIIGHACALGLRTTLVTNGTLLDPARVEALGAAGLDQATVSIWAGDAQSYDATHPGAGAGVFDRVTSGVRSLAAMRRCLGRPLVKAYHVISKANSGGLEAMVRHGLDCDVDQVEFQVIDLVPETSDDLALGQAEVREIEVALHRLKSWPEFTTHWLEKPHLRQDAPPVVWEELDDFGRFLRLGLLDGFRHLEGPHLRCARGLADEAMRKIDNDVFELTFPERVCKACSRRHRCFPDGAIGKLYVPTLKLTGAGSFLRRARAALRNPGEAEAELVRKLPCVVGDLYSRIDYRGNVVACCKGSSAPLGNVSLTTFLSVWSSPRYETFRHNAKNLSKDDPYFAPFGCHQSCDNLGMNLHALYMVDQKPENAEDTP